MEKKNVLLFWSGGKDSNLALTRLMRDPKINVMGLVTTIIKETNCIKFHGITEALLVDQAKFLGLPLVRIYLDENTNNHEYLDIITNKLKPFLKKDLKAIAFGDIHLAELRAFKEQIANILNIEALFPLWNENPESLLNEYFENNHQAIITSVKRDLLDNSFLAKPYDREWIKRLPENIDPFGENGEFHTFAIFSPFFKMRVPFSKCIAIDEGPYTVTMVKGP